MKKLLIALAAVIFISSAVYSQAPGSLVVRKSGVTIRSATTWPLAQNPNQHRVEIGQTSDFVPNIVDRVCGVTAGDRYVWIPYWKDNSAVLCNFHALYAKIDITTGRAHIRLWPTAAGADSTFCDRGPASGVVSDSLCQFIWKGPVDSISFRWSAAGYGWCEGH